MTCLMVLLAFAAGVAVGRLAGPYKPQSPAVRFDAEFGPEVDIKPKEKE